MPLFSEIGSLLSAGQTVRRKVSRPSDADARSRRGTEGAGRIEQIAIEPRVNRQDFSGSRPPYKFQATKLIAEIRESNPLPVNEPVNAVVGGTSELDLLVAETVEVKTFPARFITDAEVRASEKELVEVAESELVEVVEAQDTASERTARIRATLEKAAKSRAETVATSNPWESFRILGIAGLICVLTVAMVWLGWQLLRGTPAGIIAKADESYKARDYVQAARYYQDFTRKFVNDPNLSFAKVRLGLSNVRNAVEKTEDARQGLDGVLEMLPLIVGEAALQNEQSDLAGALIALAQKFVAQADGVTDTAVRRALMTDLDRLVGVINDTQYVGGTLRVQLSGTVQEIEEGRQRVIRQILTDEDLAKTIQEIDGKLNAKDLEGAFALKTQVAKKYPNLTKDERLVSKAIEISRAHAGLVAPGTLDVKLSKEAPLTLVQRAIQCSRTEPRPSGQRGPVVPVRVKGAVYAIDTQSGSVVWRKYVGRDHAIEPVKVTDGPASDVIVTATAGEKPGLLQRLAAASGEPLWNLTLGISTSQPVLDGDSLYVTGNDGSILSLSATSGQTNWMVKVPQSISAAPSLHGAKPLMYVVGEHSNLYVVSRQDGSCKEIVYLGHQPGSVQVGPVAILGQLLVFENRGSKVHIHVFGMSTEGLDVKPAQEGFMLSGNVMMQPQVDGRRCTVVTDLGEVATFDIDPAAEQDKVKLVATIPASLNAPGNVQMIARKNTIWVAGSGVARWDWVAGRKRYERTWGAMDGVSITSARLAGDSLIVTHPYLATEAVHVSSVSLEKGIPQWITELGTPVSIAMESKGKLFAVTSSGTAFSVDASKGQAVPTSVAPQNENGNVLQQVTTIGSEAVFVNNNDASQLVLCDPSGRMQTIKVNLRGAVPACPVTSVGDYILIATERGQVMLMDPQSGRLVCAPFQQPTVPGVSVQWTAPAYFKDSKSIVIAHSSRQLMRLAVGESIRKLSEAEVASPLLGKLNAIGNRVVALHGGPSQDSIVLYDANSLSKVAEMELPERALGECFVVEDSIFVQTGATVHAFSPDLKSKWDVTIPNATQLAASPVSQDGNWALLFNNGTVALVSKQNGQIVATGSTAEPVHGVPQMSKDGFVMGTEDGAIVQASWPTPAS